MKPSVEQFGLRVMSGQARGIGAMLLRGMLALAEPIYRGAITLRNRRFDRGTGVKTLPRPVVSVGNLTAGGTGKTPVVRWLCDALRSTGHHPVILMRGYRAQAGQRGDEQAMLEGYFEHDASAPDQPPVIVHANPNRFEGGMAVLAEHREVDLFVLDDGFQHRRLAREFDLVLVDAVNPFGYGHVHPRGLLREPICGIRRADAVLITRCDQATPSELAAIESQVRRWNYGAPIYRARHAHTHFRAGNADGTTTTLLLDALAGRRAFAFCGIGRPDAFFQQLETLGGDVVGRHAFPDHHAYTAGDLAWLAREAEAAAVDVLLTTEKDWVKLSAISAGVRLPIWRVELSIEFVEQDAAGLLGQILEVAKRVPSGQPLKG